MFDWFARVPDYLAAKSAIPKRSAYIEGAENSVKVIEDEIAECEYDYDAIYYESLHNKKPTMTFSDYDKFTHELSAKIKNLKIELEEAKKIEYNPDYLKIIKANRQKAELEKRRIEYENLINSAATAKTENDFQTCADKFRRLHYDKSDELAVKYQKLADEAKSIRLKRAAKEERKRKIKEFIRIFFRVSTAAAALIPMILTYNHVKPQNRAVFYVILYIIAFSITYFVAHDYKKTRIFLFIVSFFLFMIFEARFIYQGFFSFMIFDARFFYRNSLSYDNAILVYLCTVMAPFLLAIIFPRKN